MKSNKQKTTIRPIDKQYLIVKTASKLTRGYNGKASERLNLPHPDDNNE